MGELIWALIAFVGTHFLMSHPLRGAMVGALGEAGFRIAYSVVSIITFIWAIKAFGAAPRGEMEAWPVPDAIWIAATLLMLFASILLAGSFFGNPALPAPGAAHAATQPARGVFAITRHPMMWGIALWGLIHALIAPYQAGLMFTLAMVILALGGALGQDIKKAQLMGEAWSGWKARTSYIPFAGQLTGKNSWASAWPGRTAFLIGVLIWLVASYAHPALGAPVAGIWRWM